MKNVEIRMEEIRDKPMLMETRMEVARELRKMVEVQEPVEMLEVLERSEVIYLIGINSIQKTSLSNNIICHEVRAIPCTLHFSI